jgi:hypothetical protein
MPCSVCVDDGTRNETHEHPFVYPVIPALNEGVKLKRRNERSFATIGTPSRCCLATVAAFRPAACNDSDSFLLQPNRAFPTSHESWNGTPWIGFHQGHRCSPLQRAIRVSGLGGFACQAHAEFSEIATDVRRRSNR